ncbi:MAG: SH3 domain-containing protein, partial [Lachnospiraceae bacterium]|nr:SH3 domain-containing protein [Lachnospiraceae bacterium]
SELEARTKAPHLQDNKVMYRVNASKLYERSGPGVSHKSVGTLRHGTLVEVKELSHDGKWALVHTGTWVSTKYLEKNSEKHQGISHLGELTPEYHAKYGTSAATHGMYSSHAIHAIHSTHIANGGNAKHAIGY